MPAQNPINAGRKASRPLSEHCSIAGTIRLHIEAATMTPAANPVSALWTPILRSFFRKNTQAAPSDVPTNGIRSPGRRVSILSLPSLLMKRGASRIRYAPSLYHLFLQELHILQCAQLPPQVDLPALLSFTSEMIIPITARTSTDDISIVPILSYIHEITAVLLSFR